MTCAKAGIPQVVLPYLIENFFWAETVDTLKLGLDLKKRNDPESVVASIMQAIQMRESVASISEKLGNRDGLELACEAIENL
jgi:UDP:flavonoid glycosyltransferase YjiC (YdhE family)